MKIAVVSGGFDPLHSGHIRYINSAASLADKLVVLLNSDEWLCKKKGKEFMPFMERKTILEELKNVDLVLGFIDDEMGSCINGLTELKNLYPNDELIFCNGGDRTNENIPEMEVSNIAFKFSVGGDIKLNSSSWILKNWAYESETRVWGSFYNLFSDKGVKVKKLVVNPNSGMSYQKHFKRSEIWLVSKGQCLVKHSESGPENTKEIALKQFDQFYVALGQWHQIINPFDEECIIIEIQFGEETKEEDIERLSYYDQV